MLRTTFLPKSHHLQPVHERNCPVWTLPWIRIVRWHSQTAKIFLAIAIGFAELESGSNNIRDSVYE